MPRLLVVLQNAWGSTPKIRRQIRSRRLYLVMVMFWNSRTGKRLSKMIPPGWEVVVINASPRISSSSTEVFPPDVSHLSEWVRKTRPDVVLGCGKVAHRGLDLLGVTYISAPHPAWRSLSERTISRVRKTIKEAG